MNHQKGMILFTILWLMSILSMLTLSLMNSVLLNIRLNNTLVKKHQDFYQLEYVASRIQRNHSACTVYDRDGYKAIERLRHHEGCVWHEFKQEYRYIL